MQMNKIKGLPTPFLDNLLDETGLEILHLPTTLHILLHAKTFTMNCKNTALKYKKRVQTNLLIHPLFEMMQKILQITEKGY